MTFFILVLVINACRNVKKGSNKTNDVDPKIAKLKLPSGFHAEHLYSPKEHDQGSWVAMTFDNKGRMITSDQYGYLYRITIPSVGYDTTKSKVIVEKLEINMPGDTSKAKIKMGLAHGLLYAFNSLYVTVNDEGEADSLTRPSGLYRVQDTNGDDQYDKITLLKRFYGKGEHGPHNAVLSPDGKSLYVIAGNVTTLPSMDSYRLPSIWKDDNLLPFIKNPLGGQESELLPPGGWIVKTDSTGNNWELFSAGYRNPFDMAFNEDGELFTFDSDKEFDLGLPWYRPIRICHVTSGSEWGWRTGDGKWSPTYPDNLPPALNVGQGSPTNVMSGNNARFPEKYRRGLFAFDWSFGIIYHIDLLPVGSSYKANAEEFISGKPLPLTDGIIGPDGAMYFLTGGRRIESDLYRIYYGDNKLNNDPLPSNGTDQVIAARKIRRRLESFQEKPDATAIETAWPYLKSNDRFIRYAARIAVEHQPVSEWQERALAEKNPIILTHAMIALARNGNKNLKDKIFKSLLSVNYTQLSEPQQSDLLRAFEITLSRMGKPDDTQSTKLITYLDTKYPAATNKLNRLLSKILVFIEDPHVVRKSIALINNAKDDDSEQKSAVLSSDLILRNPEYGMAIADMLANTPPEQKIYLTTVLSAVKIGWTPELREKYFKLFYNFLQKKGGAAYIGYIDAARKLALTHVAKDEFVHYNTISGDSLLAGNRISLAALGKPKGPGRDWHVDEAVQVVQSDSGRRDFDHGRKLFTIAYCASCHRIGGQGGAIGPDLSQLGTRFTVRDILEAIIEPSKVISDQFAATKFILKDGSTVLGRLIREDSKKYYVSQNPFAPLELREVLKKDVVSNKLSTISIMPPGLIYRLNPEELKDLMAYLVSGGDSKSPVFKAKGQ